MKRRITGLHSFGSIWTCDFEFRAPDGNRPERVRCFCARELLSGREVRLDEADLLQTSVAPIDLGPDSLLVTYAGTAEILCFLKQRWPMPSYLLDLYVEHLVRHNGARKRARPAHNDLLSVARWHGLPTMESAHKAGMRGLAMEDRALSEAEMAGLVLYNADDVRLTEQLLLCTAEAIDWPAAMRRGRYIRALAHVQWHGIPVRAEFLRQVTHYAPQLVPMLIERQDVHGLYDGDRFVTARFDAWLTERGLPWPRHELTSALDLREQTFREMTELHPEVAPIWELRRIVALLRRLKVHVGTDGRNRCSLFPFMSRTGRNQPSNVQFLMGGPFLLRNAIEPPPGHIVVEIDYTAQEFGIMAGLSRDPAMTEDYLTGDPYLALAKRAGLVPLDATKDSHREVRKRVKIVALAVMMYGQGAASCAERLGISVAAAEDLMAMHRVAYPVFWAWLERFALDAAATDRVMTVHGWPCRVTGMLDPKSDRLRFSAVQNWPAQAHGGDVLRLAVCALVEAGIEVIAPVHDSLLILVAEQDHDRVVERACEMMTRAGEAVCGLPLQVEPKDCFGFGAYPDPDGRGFMWPVLNRLLAELLQGGKSEIVAPAQ